MIACPASLPGPAGWVSPGVAQPRTDTAQWLLTLVLLTLLVGRNVFNKPVLAATLLAYLPLAVASQGRSVQLLPRCFSLGALWLLLAASYSWAVVPRVTLDMILTQSAFMALALLIALRDQAVGFSSSLRLAAALLLPLVAVYCLLFPGASFSAAGLNGFYLHKNNLGSVMAVCALALFYAPGLNKGHAALGMVAVGLLAASLSKTSIALFVTCGFLLLVADSWGNRVCSAPGQPPTKRTVRLVAHVLVLLGLAALVLFRDDLLDLLWTHLPKTALTGRGTLWLAVMQQMRVHSLLGIGPGAFWLAGDASEIAQTSLYRMDSQWVQRMVSADGGYVDLVASLGVLGLVLFVVTAVDLYRRLFRNWYQPDSRLVFVLATFVLLHAITESTILYSTNILWLVYLLCYFRVASYASPGLPARRQNGWVRQCW
jgi:exopolysaccharide production protein ExoQ